LRLGDLAYRERSVAVDIIIVPPEKEELVLVRAVVNIVVT
jgi:hypothetical protein